MRNLGRFIAVATTIGHDSIALMGTLAVCQTETRFAAIHVQSTSLTRIALLHPSPLATVLCTTNHYLCVHKPVYGTKRDFTQVYSVATWKCGSFWFDLVACGGMVDCFECLHYVSSMVLTPHTIIMLTAAVIQPRAVHFSLGLVLCLTIAGIMLVKVLLIMCHAVDVYLFYVLSLWNSGIWT